MCVDILSKILRAVQLRGTVFHYLGFGRDWAIEAPALQAMADKIIPDAAYVMQYHVITKGTGWASIAGAPPVRLAAGDIVILPHGHRHRLSSEPGISPLRLDAAADGKRDTPANPAPVMFGAACDFPYAAPGPDSVNCIACGFFGCDLLHVEPLIANLPHLLHLPAGAEGGGMDQMMMQAISNAQSQRPGGQAVLDRLCETMFMDAIRRHVERLPKESGGWRAAMGDRLISLALTLIHDEPSKAWTVDMLAREAALSRSAFYDRFVRLVGEPPMQYLRKWRMVVATKLLRECKLSIAAVALYVGYESEAAFARAFKRVTGTPPARWRKEHAALAAR